LLATILRKKPAGNHLATLTVPRAVIERLDQSDELRLCKVDAAIGPAVSNLAPVDSNSLAILHRHGADPESSGKVPQTIKSTSPWRPVNQPFEVV
jgi:hypothetical protein